MQELGSDILDGLAAGIRETPTILTEQAARSIADYGRNIRAAVRGLWNGALDFDQFYDSMFATMDFYLNRIWRDALAVCGITPQEQSPDERAAIAQKIANEKSRLFGFAEAIEAGSKANRGKLTPLLKRAEMWSNRGLDVFNTGKVMACGNQKLMWNINPAKDNCPSCLSLDKKVKRASYWRRIGVHPQSPVNPKLQCKGYKCGCSLDPTDAPLSRGPLPSLP